MTAFDLLKEFGHEQLVISQDPGANYVGIVAIHDTTLGPALGGTRLWNYAKLEDAIVDALRLARGMTYKSAVAGLPLGGGKSVVIGDPARRDREACFRAHGRYVDTLGGRYIMAMKAAAKVRWGKDTLTGRRVAVQGAGKVAQHLARHLHEEGAKLIVSDIDDAKVQRFVADFGAAAVAPDAIYDAAVDVYAPCALGATLNDQTIPRLKAEIVCGGANNQLADPRHAAAVEKRGVFYTPDYVANGGGVINICREIEGWSEQRALDQAAGIYDTVLRVVEVAQREKVTTAEAADRLAEERLAAVRALREVRRQ